MQWSRTVLLFILVLGSSTTLAMDYELAIGMAAPSPTGISVKKWLDEENAVGMLFEWSTRDERFVGSLDFITHDFGQVEVDEGIVATYYGFGLRTKTQRGKSSTFGIRIPVGINYLLPSKPIGLFAELGPRADVIPNTSFAVDMVIGIRYRFIP